MAIDALLTGSVIVVSAAAPPALARFSRFSGGTIFFASVPLAMAASEIVIRIAKPDVPHGALYAVAVLMNLCISAIVVTLAMPVTLWLRRNRMQRELP